MKEVFHDMTNEGECTFVGVEKRVEGFEKKTRADFHQHESQRINVAKFYLNCIV